MPLGLMAVLTVSPDSMFGKGFATFIGDSIQEFRAIQETIEFVVR